MHVNQETYITVFLSPAETGQLTVELQAICEVIDLSDFPAFDRLSDAIIHRDAGNEL
jgi:hypothetical protein